LADGLSRLPGGGDALGVVCTDETMLQILEVTGLNRVFSVYGTRDGALEEESAR